MEKSIKYTNHDEIKTITYKFTSEELRDIIIKEYKIPITKYHSFDLFEADVDKPDRAILTMIHSMKE